MSIPRCGVAPATCLVLSIVACAGAAAPPAEGSGEQDTPRAASARTTPRPSLDSLPPVGWNEVDRGTGIVHFREMRPAPSADTLRVWRSPALDTIVALLILEVPSPSGYSYRMEQVRGGAGVAGNLLEYGYEEIGLPLDSLDAAAGLARVIYALDSARSPLRGWTRLTPELEHLSWSSHLASVPVFFVEGVPAAFHSSPGGPSLSIDVRSADYDMTPDSVAGDWLRVTVRSPHGCSGEPPAREVVAWIRYLDPVTRRPRVWYPTRGC